MLDVPPSPKKKTKTKKTNPASRPEEKKKKGGGEIIFEYGCDLEYWSGKNSGAFSFSCVVNLFLAKFGNSAAHSN